MKKSVLAAFSILVAVGPMGAAAAPDSGSKDRPTRVAVVNLGKIDLDSIKVVNRAYEGLKSRSLGVPIEPIELRWAFAGAPRNLAGMRAANALSKGKAAYASLKKKEAVRLLRQAEIDYLEHVSVDDARKGLQETWVYLLLSLHDLGNAGQAGMVADGLSAILQGRRPDEVPTATWQRYTHGRQKGIRTISIDAPKSSLIYLDMRLVGRGRSSGGGLYGGVKKVVSFKVDTNVHHLAVEAKGYDRYYTRISAGRDSQTVRIVLDAASKDSYAWLRQKLEKLRSARKTNTRKLAALLKSMGVDRAVLMAREASKISLRLLDVHTAKIVARPETVGVQGKYQELKSVFRRWASVVRRSGKIHAAGPRPDTVTGPAPFPDGRPSPGSGPAPFPDTRPVPSPGPRPAPFPGPRPATAPGSQPAAPRPATVMGPRPVPFPARPAAPAGVRPKPRLSPHTASAREPVPPTNARPAVSPRESFGPTTRKEVEPKRTRRFWVQVGPAMGVGLAMGRVEVIDINGRADTDDPKHKITSPGMSSGSLGLTLEAGYRILPKLMVSIQGRVGYIGFFTENVPGAATGDYTVLARVRYDIMSFAERWLTLYAGGGLGFAIVRHIVKVNTRTDSFTDTDKSMGFAPTGYGGLLIGKESLIRGYAEMGFLMTIWNSSDLFTFHLDFSAGAVFSF